MLIIYCVHFMVASRYEEESPVVAFSWVLVRSRPVLPPMARSYATELRTKLVGVLVMAIAQQLIAGKQEECDIKLIEKRDGYTVAQQQPMGPSEQCLGKNEASKIRNWRQSLWCDN